MALASPQAYEIVKLTTNVRSGSNISTSSYLSIP